MACPTCDHTMQRVSHQDIVFWCPRCGTIKNEISDTADVPALVGRCRKFQADCLLEGTATPAAVGLWCRLGCVESINTPAERPPV